MRGVVLAAVALLGVPLAAQTPSTLATPSPAVLAMLSPAGDTALAYCADGHVRVWTLTGTQTPIMLDLHGAVPWNGAVSAHGDWLAYGTHEGVYSLLNTRTGARQWEFTGAAYPSAMALDDAGKWLAIAQTNGSVQLLDLTTGKEVRKLAPLVGGVQDIAFSPDGKRLATADSDTSVRVFDVGTGAELWRFNDFTMEPLAVTFSLDGHEVLSGGGDSFLAILDAQTGKLLRRTPKFADPIGMIRLSPDGKLAMVRILHAANLDQSVPMQVVELSTAAVQRSWQPPPGRFGYALLPGTHLLVATPAAEGLRLARPW